MSDNTSSDPSATGDSPQTPPAGPDAPLSFDKPSTEGQGGHGSPDAGSRPPASGEAPSWGQPGVGSDVPQAPAYTQPPAYGQQPGYGQEPAYGQQPGYGQQPPAGQNPYAQNPYAQNPYAQNPYAQNPYGGPVPGSTSALAIVSMILGIVGVAGGFLVLALVPIAAIITGFIARRRARQFQQQGSGMALAGIITGFVGVAFFAVYAVILIVAVIATGSSSGSGY